METEGSRFVLFEGEATGHAHTLHMEESDMLNPTPSVYQLADREGELVFEITSVASLQHEEHGSLMLEPGVYCARRQREFSWGGCNGLVPFETLAKCREDCEDSLLSEVLTKDWLTYRNEEHGFEFKYPPFFNCPISLEVFCRSYKKEFGNVFLLDCESLRLNTELLESRPPLPFDCLL